MTYRQLASSLFMASEASRERMHKWVATPHGAEDRRACNNLSQFSLLLCLDKAKYDWLKNEAPSINFDWCHSSPKSLPQPRSQGSLLPALRVGENSGNEVVITVHLETWCLWKLGILWSLLSPAKNKIVLSLCDWWTRIFWGLCSWIFHRAVWISTPRNI